MKKLYLLAMTAMVMGCAQKAQVAIQGNIEGLDGMVWLMTKSGNVIDSTTVTDGQFTFSLETGENVTLYLTDNSDMAKADFGKMLLLEPGTITITDESVSGTPANDAYMACSKRKSELSDQYYAASTDAERDSIDALYSQYEMEVYKENKNNVAGIILLRSLSYEEITGQALIDELESMPEGFRNLNEWKNLMNAADKQLKTANGKPYLEFSQTDAQGNPISLKSVVEKPGNRYVLLDFWASWCRPCMGEVPYLTKDYAEFHDKGFEIFGVSLDMDRDSWLKAISEKNMNWVHVSDVNYWDNEVAKLYGVNSIPTNFLIDCKTGLIVAKNLRGEKLGEKLQELLILQ